MTPQTDTALNPAAVRTGEGEARWWFGSLAEIKVRPTRVGG
jgi:hypothetical protein